jgi:hypothetical protein
MKNRQTNNIPEFILSVQRFLRQFNWTALFLLALIILAPWGAPLVAAVKMNKDNAGKSKKNINFEKKLKEMCENDTSIKAWNQPGFPLTLENNTIIPFSCFPTNTNENLAICQSQKKELKDFNFQNNNTIVNSNRQARRIYQDKYKKLHQKKFEEFFYIVPVEQWLQLGQVFEQLEFILDTLYVANTTQESQGGYCEEHVHKALVDQWKLAKKHGLPAYSYVLTVEFPGEKINGHVIELPYCVDSKGKKCQSIDTNVTAEISTYLNTINFQESSLCDKWNKFFGPLIDDSGHWLQTDSITHLIVYPCSPTFLNEYLKGLPEAVIQFCCSELENAGFSLKSVSSCASFFKAENKAEPDNEQDAIREMQQGPVF